MNEPNVSDLPEVVDASVTSASPSEASIVDWSRTGRRLRRVLLVLGAMVVVGWIIAGVVADAGFGLRLLAELTGFALLMAVGAEVVIVGGAAVGGMLRAGERGERLASPDVSLLPPQLRRRRRN